jgi:glycogen debranching enzyme
MNTPESDIIEIDDQYYIEAESSLADHRTHVLMRGDLFAVLDYSGNIAFGEQGLFFQEARHLSKFVISVQGQRFLSLSAEVRQDNATLGVDLTNPDTCSVDTELARGTVHLKRTKFLFDDTCYENFEVQNYNRQAVTFELLFEFGADFADIFEIRGHPRRRFGRALEPEITAGAVTLGYEGLDGIVRRTTVEPSITPTRLGSSEFCVTLTLQPYDKSAFSIRVICDAEHKKESLPYEIAYKVLNFRVRQNDEREADISTSNQQFNHWLNRSKADLKMLTTLTPDGLYPYAGVPWYSTIFGRDGIITALEYLWLEPALTKGVLLNLAVTQATEVIPDRDAEPGKIVHEIRKGELARIGEVPFGRYYGTVDATPLFILLAAAYFERTRDLELLSSIWPNIERALEWIDGSGDCDKDGFIEYKRSSPNGLVQQGWKDSQDSVFHADGRLAQGPIALCEVQAYVYAAKCGISETAAALGHQSLAESLQHQALALRKRFEAAFWCEEIGSYALALDGAKEQCRVSSSNAGQCLFTGIATLEHAQTVAQGLTGSDFYSGWGVRTIASSAARYNPMSYHNGSVWPHDNALMAFGVHRSKTKELACEILSGLLDASAFLDLHRLPELFCGFPRDAGRGPTLYPVACAPQAWAAGAVFLILQSCLGLRIRAAESRVYFYHPALPKGIERVNLRNLCVGNGSVDLDFFRQEHAVSIGIVKRQGDVEIVVVK